MSLIAAIAVVLADQITKLAIVSTFARGEQTDILGAFFRLGHARNSGAVFGIMRGLGRYFTVFSIVAAAVIIVVIFLARQAQRRVRVGLGLVLGGALGNLIDRLHYGAVIDFIDIGANDAVRWPSFNIADLAITVGVALLVVSSFKPGTQHCQDDSQGNIF
ncbi:MAG: signal peptidase II [Candidatus Eisenbacteria bacterium]